MNKIQIFQYTFFSTINLTLLLILIYLIIKGKRTKSAAVLFLLLFFNLIIGFSLVLILPEALLFNVLMIILSLLNISLTILYYKMNQEYSVIKYSLIFSSIIIIALLSSIFIHNEVIKVFFFLILVFIDSFLFSHEIESIVNYIDSIELQKNVLKNTIQNLKTQTNKDISEYAETVKKFYISHRNEWNWLRISCLLTDNDDLQVFTESINLNDRLAIITGDIKANSLKDKLLNTATIKMAFVREKDKISSLRQYLLNTNINILNNNETLEYLTCFTLVFNTNYRFSYTNASFQRPLHYRHLLQKTEILDTDGIMLGVPDIKKEMFEEKTGFLEINDKILLYNSNVVDIRDSMGNEFGIFGLIELLNDYHKLEQNELLEKIREKLEEFKGEAPKNVFLMLIEIKPEYKLFKTEIKLAEKAIASKNYNTALKKFNELTEKYPNNKEILENLGKLYIRLKKYKKALSYLKKVLYMQYTSSELLGYIGICYHFLNENEDAKGYLNEALELNNSNISALLLLGNIYEREKNYSEAEKYYTRLLKIRPDLKKAKIQLDNIRKKQDFNFIEISF